MSDVVKGKSKRLDHAKAAGAFIAKTDHVAFHDKRLWDLRSKRDAQAHGMPEWETLRELASAMHTLPQVLINVEVSDKTTVATAPSVQAAVADAEAELGDTGRILLRPSGTEQMVRVMVEAPDEDTAKQVALRVASCVSEQR